MPASSSKTHLPRPLRSDEVGVSEVIGFLLTFGIISVILLVAMLGFNSAQKNAEERLIEIQGSGAAQRVAAAAVDLALFVQDDSYNVSAPYNVSVVSVALDLPAELQGITYNVFLCQSSAVALCNCPAGSVPCPAAPYVKVSSSRGTAQYQSTFLLAGKQFCPAPYHNAAGGIVLVSYYPPAAASAPQPKDCIGLRDEAL